MNSKHDSDCRMKFIFIRFIIFLLALVPGQSLSAGCDTGETFIVIRANADDFFSGDGTVITVTIGENIVYMDTPPDGTITTIVDGCFPQGALLSIDYTDSFGDGITTNPPVFVAFGCSQAISTSTGIMQADASSGNIYTVTIPKDFDDTTSGCIGSGNATGIANGNNGASCTSASLNTTNFGAVTISPTLPDNTTSPTFPSGVTTYPICDAAGGASEGNAMSGTITSGFSEPIEVCASFIQPNITGNEKGIYISLANPGITELLDSNGDAGNDGNGANDCGSQISQYSLLDASCNILASNTPTVTGLTPGVSYTLCATAFAADVFPGVDGVYGTSDDNNPADGICVLTDIGLGVQAFTITPCQSAIEISPGVELTAQIDALINATNELNCFTGDGNTYPARALWYHLEGDGDTYELVQNSSDFNEIIMVYEGDCNSLQCVGYSSRASLTIETDCSTDYYFMVSGFNTNVFGSTSFVVSQIGNSGDPTITCPGNQTLLANTSCEATLADYTNLATASDNCSIRTVILDHESPSSSTTFQYFGGSAEGSINNIISNPDPSGINTSSTVGEFIKVGDAPTWGGAFSNPDPSIPMDLTNTTELCIKVHMDHIGNLALKVDQSTTGGPDWIQTKPNSLVNQWEELCFDLTMNSLEEPFSTPIGNSYNRIVLFFDFQMEGTGIDVTSYFDDLVVKKAAMITQDPPAGTIISSNTSVTLTATDGSGNSETCSFDVLFGDTELPMIICPDNIVASTNMFDCSAVVEWDPPVVTDNCTVSSITSSHNSGDTFPGLTTTIVQYIVTDASGNMNTCQFTIDVVDVEAPSIECPTNVIVDNCTGIVTWDEPMVHDNCAESELIIDATHSSGGVFPIGTTTVTYTVTDQSPEVVSCSFDVTVQNIDALNLTSPADDFTAGTHVIQANNSITASNKIRSTADVVTYRAGNEILLEAGFDIELNAEFQALIAGCESEWR